MIRTGARSQQGYTLVELMVVVAIAAGAVGLAAGLFRSADDLSDASQHRMDAATELREAHEGIASVLRNASLATITALDTTGSDHAPRFQLVTGATDGAIDLGDLMEIAYERTTADLEGAGPVGRLLLRRVGEVDGETLVTQVAEGSWLVALDGRLCAVRVGVVSTSHGEEPLTFTTTSSIFLENP